MLERVHRPPQKFLQKKDGKNIPFLDKEITYLKGGRGGTKGHNQKNLPHVVFAFLGPPWIYDRLWMTTVLFWGGSTAQYKFTRMDTHCIPHF
jgi:hypothetical protein